MRPLLFLAAAALGATASAAEAPQIAPAKQPIRIDGVIDAAEWAGMATQSLAYEIEPQSVAATAWQTTLRISHDGSNLLLAIDARDEDPDRIVASRGARDNVGDEDYISVVIDAEGNRQRHYVFSVNAAGTLEDAIIGGAAAGSPQWSGAWEAAVQRTANGYTVEMQIPLTTLNASKGSNGMNLPMNVTRHIGRDRRETVALLPIDTRQICQECQYSLVTLTGLGADRQSVTVRPYVAARRSTRYPATGGSSSNSSVDPGVDLLWQLGGGRKVVGTVNPDFSEVAPDQIQFDVNRRFAVTFTENRPFFTENSGVFGTTLPLVYTRSISDPSAALAYSATNSRSTMAAMVARDRVTSFLVPGQNRSRLVALDGESETFLGRAQYNGFNGRRVGTLVTARHGDDYDYQLAAIDGRTTIGERQSIEAIVAVSHAELGSVAAAGNFLPEDSSGGMLRITHNYKKGYLGVFTAMNRSTPDFRADTGNQSRVGITHVHHEYWWSVPQAPGGVFSNISGGIWGNYADYLHDGGRDGNVEVWGSMSLSDGSGMDAHVHGTVDTYQGRDYKLYDIGGGYGWQINESLRVNAGLTTADVIDFVGSEKGHSLRSFTGFNVKLGATLSLSGNLNIDRTHGDTVRNFTTKSSLLKANWSPRLGHTVSFVGNWGATRTRSKLTSAPAEHSDRLRGQVVYLYQRPDRTAFHVGVNIGGAGTDGMSSVSRTDELVFSKFVLNLDWKS
jgi:hypothetical protein